MANPIATLDARFSHHEAQPRAWTDAETLLDTAERYTLVTVRADGRPHATSIIGAWLDDAMYFCTGAGEQKAKNLDANPRCLVTHGNHSAADSLDLVLEGQAVQEGDTAVLQQVADRYVEKYGEEWRFEVVEGGFRAGDAGTSEGEPTRVYRIAPQTVFGFTNGDLPGQTRWTFDA
jgi:general stress protein 26